MPLEKYITILQNLTNTKSGWFVIGVLCCGVPCYFILDEKTEVVHQTLEKEKNSHIKLDSCQAQKDDIYLKGFKDGSATRSEEFENAKKQVMEINNLATKKEAELRKSIDNKKKQINSLKNE